MHTNSKGEIQEEQYDFPYHFIPEVENDAIVANRFLQWSMAYMGYISLVKDDLLKTNAQNIIDVGCGDGRMLYELERSDPERKYTGIDISERALHFARGFTRHSKFEIFDVIESPYQFEFDACTYIETIEHIPPEKIKIMMSNIAKSLKKDGILYLTTPTTNITTSAKHYQHFDLEKIKMYLDDSFEIVEVQYLNKENWLSKTLARLLVNKAVSVNLFFYRKLIFKLYNQHCLHGHKKTGSRIYVKARRK
jgi:SAM-dependent methyltransferase